MTADLVVLSGSTGLSPAEQALTEHGAVLDRASLSEATRRAYERDWAQFVGWCALTNRTPLPADVETVKLYLADLDSRVDENGRWEVAPSSMRRYLSSIAHRHNEAGLESPTRRQAVLLRMKGIANTRQHETRQMRALLLDQIQAILQPIDRTTLTGARDAFVILLGFGGAFRRSEMAQLQNRDLERRHDGLWVKVRRSKTDQEGHGRFVGIPYGQRLETCVPCAWVRWLAMLTTSELGGGHVCREEVPEVDPQAPLLRSLRNGQLGGPMTGAAIHAMIQRRAAAVGLREMVGAHSLRAGFVTGSLSKGASPSDVMDQTGHRSVEMVRRYKRDRGANISEAAIRLGL